MVSTTSTHSKRKSGKQSDGGSAHKKSKRGASAPAVNATTTKQDRQSHRKHADIVVDGKRLWNQLRLKTNTAEQTRKLVEELISLIMGNVCEISLQHDASRVVQAAIQFGNARERQQILKELCTTCKDGGSNISNSNTTMVELCKSQYAHFVVLKAVKYCHTDKDSVHMITTALKGHVAKLAVHATASRVVESLFQTLTPKQTAVLKQELYGPHFALFASSDLQQKQNNKVPTLASNLEQAPEKKQVTLDFVRQLVNKGMEKQLYGFTYFQEYLLEYLELVPPTEIRTMAATAADHAIHLLSGRAGTKVVALLTAYGTAKDRKRILKCLKGYCRSGLLHRDAYLAILRLVELTDDTVSVQKNLLNELLSKGTAGSNNNKNDNDENQDSPLLEIALSDTASKLFLMLLVSEANAEARKKILDPYEHSVLFANPVILENGMEVPTSKKDPEVRRKELLKHMREPLIELCNRHADDLLRSIPGSAILREVYGAFKPVSVVDAVLDVCAVSLSDKEKSISIFEDVIGHRAVKNLILIDAAQDKVQEEVFVTQFVSCFEDRLTDVASSNRGAFVVAALCQVSGLGRRVAKKLNRGELKKLSNGKAPTAGYDALLKEISKW